MRRRSLIAVLAGMLALPWSGAGAASLQISPVSINLRAGQGASGISLQNQGEAPVYGQVRVYLWQQQGGDDVLTPTQEVVASPPIIQIGPKASQIIRLVRRAEAAPAGELAYRILIDEIPREDAPASNGVDIRLRYSVPMFVLPADERGVPALEWRLFRKDGNWMLRVRNKGGLHAQIGALALADAGGKEHVLAQGLFGYVLAGQVREWRLPLAGDVKLDGALTVKAMINARALTAPAPQE
jgi:fimbrial chaperone protein